MKFEYKELPKGKRDTARLCCPKCKNVLLFVDYENLHRRVASISSDFTGLVRFVGSTDGLQQGIGNSTKRRISESTCRTGRLRDMAVVGLDRKIQN